LRDVGIHDHAPSTTPDYTPYTPSTLISTRTRRRRHVDPHYINLTTSTSATYPDDDGTQEEEDGEEVG